MASIKPKSFFTVLVLLLFLSSLTFFQNCKTVPPEIYDNPLDTLAIPEDGEQPIETPAVVFFPGEVTVGLGLGATVQVFALDVNQLAGTHIIVNYDKNKLNLLSVTEGEFFSESLETIFIYENNPTSGSLDIYASYLGNDTVAVSGTGSIASLVFTTVSAGQSVLTYSANCEFVDAENNPIQINGFREGVINAQ